MHFQKIPLAVAALVVLLLAAAAIAVAPNQISYQGELLGSGGQPVTDTVPMNFSIFDSPLPGAHMLWSEGQPAVAVIGGLFSVMLGASGVPLPDTIFAQDELWLQVVVDGQPISPRSRLTTMPYSFSSRSVSGDITTAQGELTISQPSKTGGYMDFRVLGNVARMRLVPEVVGTNLPVAEMQTNPEQVRLLLNRSASGPEDDSLLAMSADFTGNSRLALFNSQSQHKVMEITSSPTVGPDLMMFPVWETQPVIDMHANDSLSEGCLTLTHIQETENDAITLTGRSLTIVEGANSLVKLTGDGLQIRNCLEGPKGKLQTKYGCDQIVEDTVSGETLMVAGVEGFYCKASRDKGSWDSYLAPTGFKMASGAGAGLVLTSDAGGVGTWQPPSGGGGWCLSNDALYTCSRVGIARQGNTLDGTNDSTHVNLGVDCITGYGPENTKYASVTGGLNNAARGEASWIGGGKANYAGGMYSCIPGGYRDTITAESMYSMAFGNNVYLNSGATVAFFAGGDYYGYVGINRDDRYGGINYPLHIGTNGSNGNGAYLTAGGTWTNGSSRAFKENFTPLDAQQLLSRIAVMPIESWNYKGTTEQHIGPTAEDFVAAFDVGAVRKTDGQRDNQYLAAGDVAGVALAGVKELVVRNGQLQAEVTQLRGELAELKAIVQQLARERQ